MNCPICKKELEPNLSSCPYCGTPIKESNGDYVKGEFMIRESTSNKKHKERAHEEYVKKSRTIAGFCSLFSFPLMLGALIFMLFTFVTFNPGTPQEMPGLTLVPYSICFLVPSFLMAILAFFKSKDINFKSANRIAVIEVIVDGILTIFGFVILVLLT
jgi:hypothetical protein